MKGERKKPGGELQPLEIPNWKWEDISMDFVSGLPRTRGRNDSIWVIVDRLTKSAHFLPVRKTRDLESLARLYLKEIGRLHGAPRSIVSDRDSRFVSRFWTSLQEALGTKLSMSTAYHPQSDGQTERTIQTLEDMLRACVLDFGGSWEEHLHLVEFAYNNSYHSSIGMAPFEALYGRPCRSPTCWMDFGEQLLLGPELVQQTNDLVKKIQQRLQTAQSRQKSYVDKRRRPLAFNEGDQVFLKVSPRKGIQRYGKKGKLAPRYIGPFKIIGKVGSVAYRLELPSQLANVHPVFHVSMLRKYEPDPSHVIDHSDLILEDDASFEVKPVRVVDCSEKVLRGKSIPLVRILWSQHGIQEETWELETEMRSKYPELFTGMD